VRYIYTGFHDKNHTCFITIRPITSIILTIIITVHSSGTVLQMTVNDLEVTAGHQGNSVCCINADNKAEFNIQARDVNYTHMHVT